MKGNVEWEEFCKILENFCESWDDMAKTLKEYCTQNNGECVNCSLSSYGKDCKNNPVRGGLRPGSGRPSTGRKKRQFYITDEECELIKKYIEELRSNKALG